MLIDQPRTLDRIYKSLMILALVVTGLILMSNIVIPLAFAALFAVVLNPFVARLEQRLGRIAALVVVLLATFVVISLLMWFIINQLTGLVASLPGLEEQFYSMLNRASYTVNDLLGVSTEEQAKMLKEGLTSLTSYLGEVLLSTSYLAYFFIQVPIYIFLFILYREKFKQFFLSFTADSELKWRKEIEGVVRGYISGLTIVVLIAGILNSIGLLLLGIDHAIFFGFLSGALTLIPYVGITIGATLPALLALVTKDSLWYAVGVIGVHTLVQFLEGNFITPKVTGSRISINAFAAILALLIGGKILGIAGMILAVPCVGIVKILMSHSTSLKRFVVLLEDKPAETEASNPAPLDSQSN